MTLIPKVIWLSQSRTLVAVASGRQLGGREYQKSSNFVFLAAAHLNPILKLTQELVKQVSEYNVTGEDVLW